jgi:hypothetical protein
MMEYMSRAHEAVLAPRRRVRRSAVLPNDWRIWVLLAALDVLASIAVSFAESIPAGLIVLGVGGVWVGFLGWHLRQR